MNSSYGINQTRATFGCSLHPDYIDKDAFQCIYNVASLAPSVTTILEPAIRYAVPVSSICRPIIEDAIYSILSEMDGSVVEPIIQCTSHSTAPHHYTLVRVPNRRSVDRVTIRYETVSKGFTLREDASYSDVIFYHTRKTVIFTAWGRQWTMQFREVFYYPTSNPTDLHIFFEGRPRYEVELITSGHVEEGIVLNTLEMNLPHIYRPKSDRGCVTAFSRTPNN